jgi:hypothetical protein
MVNLIDAYLVKLESRLKKKIPATEVIEHVTEISTHLRESVADRMRKGESETNASISALRSIGPYRLVANSLIRARFGVDDRSSWRIAWPILTSLVVYFALMFGIEYELFPFWFFAYVSWVATAFMALFIVIVWKSRRLLWAPLTATVGAVCFVVVASQIALTNQLHSKTLKSMDTMIFDGRRLAASAEAATKGMPSDLMIERKDGGYQAPDHQLVNYSHQLNWTPILIKDKQALHYGLSIVNSKSKAEALWRKNGAQFAASLRNAVQSELKNRAEIVAEKPGLLEVWISVGNAVPAAAGFLLILIGFNLLILLLEVGLRKAITMMWRPERLA